MKFRGSVPAFNAGADDVCQESASAYVSAAYAYDGDCEAQQ